MKSMFWSMFVLVVLMAIFLVYASARENRRQQIMFGATPTLGQSDRYVRYQVQGGGAYAHITLTNRNGDSDQYFDHLPYSMVIAARPGQAISLAAQDDGYGEITCQIFLDGQKIDESTATGKYSTATCSGSVP